MEVVGNVKRRPEEGVGRNQEKVVHSVPYFFQDLRLHRLRHLEELPFRVNHQQ